MKYMERAVVSTIMIAVLASCGGRMESVELVKPDDHPDPRVNSALVEDLAGTPPSTHDAADYHAAIADLITTSNVLVMSDSITLTTGGVERDVSACLGAGCLFHDRMNGETYGTSASSFTVDETFFVPITVVDDIHLAVEDDYFEPTLDAYVGLLSNGYFGVQMHENADGEPRLIAYSSGISSFGPPSSTMHWQGAVTAIDMGPSRDRTDMVQGVAELSFTSDEMAIDASFRDMINLSNGAMIDDIEWMDVPLFGSGFVQGNGADRISGRFWGTDHGEVSGIFERNSVLGAFGARKR